MANEYGPFESEREALATRAAAMIRAAYDDHPGYGASVPECLKVMTDECEASGVALGAWDLSFLQGVAWGETADCIRLRGLIRRAFEAGKTVRLEGAVTLWGVQFGPDDTVQRYHYEDAARQAHRDVEALDASRRGTVVSRQAWAGPWTPAPDEEGTDA
jgi:hypothetical protein